MVTHLIILAPLILSFYRACIVCHFCQNNCFFILLSWLPTYFHDNFPSAPSWIFNVVPWLFMTPGIVGASAFSSRLLASGFNVGKTRKVAEGICMVGEALCLVLIGEYKSDGYPKHAHFHDARRTLPVVPRGAGPGCRLSFLLGHPQRRSTGQSAGPGSQTQRQRLWRHELRGGHSR